MVGVGGRLTWTFKLREGVKFHSGKDFSSADVVWSFKRLLDEKTGSGARAVLEFLDADGISAPDATTVVFKTKNPVVELPVLITNKFTNIVPDGATRRDAEAEGRRHRPVHAGAVHAECAGAHPAQEPELLERRPAEVGMPAHHGRAEAVAAVSAIKAGQVDLMLNVDPSVIPTLKDDPSVKLLETAASNSMTVSAADRHAALRQSEGARGNEAGGRPPGDGRHRAARLRRGRRRQSGAGTAAHASYVKEAPKQDIEKAKALLAEAGYKDGLSFDLYTAEGVPGMVLMAQVYAEMAKAAGMNINVIVTPAESFGTTSG